MECVLVTKAAYQGLAWPVTFSELVAKVEGHEPGFSSVQVLGRPHHTLSGSPEKGYFEATPKDYALLYRHGRSGQAYLLVQNW